MRISRTSVAVITAVLAASSLAGCDRSARLTSAKGVVGLCTAAPVRTEALDNPNKHAWDLFLQVNHPAQDETKARGEPDCGKSIGAPGTTTVWETWRNAATEVFKADGSEPPEWGDTQLPDEKPGQTPPAPVDDAGAPILSMHGMSASAAGPTEKFSPEDGVFNDEGGFGETRMNRATYDFIREQCLFSIEGGQRYAKAVALKKKPPIQFPVDSIEAKAAWLDFEKEKVPASKWNTYYVAEYKGKKYGLVALHILTKDTPNWFWATFHHKDAPHNEFERPDTHGRPKILDGTVWENYVLGGVQIDFIEPTGEATRLSDHYVEFGFQRSSCITCHATATISSTAGMPAPQPRALCSMTPDLPNAGLPPATCRKVLGADAFKPGSDELLIERGAPDPKWFQKDGAPYYLQTDFVWAIPFRSKNEKGPPPSRCLW